MKRYIMIIAVCLVIPALLNAQSLYKARKQMEKYNYSSAIEILKKALNEDNTKNEAIPMLAECYRMQRDVFNSKATYARAIALPDAKAEYFYFYAQALQSTGEYAKAREMYHRYAEKNPSDPRGNLFAAHCDSVLGPWKRFTPQFEMGITNQDVTRGALSSGGVDPQPDGSDSAGFLSDFGEDVKKSLTDYNLKRNIPQLEVKLASNINTQQSDFGAAFYSGDFIFTSDYYIPKEKNLYGWTGRGYLNIMKARPESTDDFWGEMGDPSEFDNRFDQKYHDGPATFSTDGNSIYFTRSFYGKAKRKDGYKTNMLKIYYATKTDSVWGDVKPFYLNSTEYSVGHPALSNNGQILYFVSDMPGGEGGTDIWMCKRNGDSWGPVLKLDSTVNTKENEMFPSVGDDGALYFASDGHPGYGGFDVFKTQRVDERWTQPVNLQQPVNGPYDDFAFAYAPGGRSGFFSSNRPGGVGSDDIYAFRITEPSAPIILPTYIRGLVKDKTTLQPIAGATVFLFNTTTGFVKILKTDTAGIYKTIVFNPADYLVKAMMINYIADCTPFMLASLKPGKTINAPRDLLLDKLIVNKIFRIDNIYYDFDKYNIREDAKPELDKLVRILKENAITVELGSHTDCRGSLEYNDKLSQKRAESAVNYIISNDIDMSRITAKGYGERQLINKCADDVDCTPEEHQANRRTEFKPSSLKQVDAVPEYDLTRFTGGEEIPGYVLGPDFFNNCALVKRIEKITADTVSYTLPAPPETRVWELVSTPEFVEKPVVQVVSPNPEILVYKVQLSTLNVKKPLNAPEFKTAKDLEVYKDGDKYRYVSGKFNTYAEALSYRDKMAQLGFKDAFVILLSQGKLTRANPANK